MPAVNTAAVPIVPRYRRWPAVLAGSAALVLVLIASCEALGWPFLADPLQRWLSGSLHRRVNLSIDGHTPASVVVRLVGRIRIEAPQIEIGAPDWSSTPRMLSARDAVVSLHYADLWRAYRGGPLRIHMLEAAEIDADVERLADGRASWDFGGSASKGTQARSLQFPLFDNLKVQTGTLRLRDDASALRIAIASRPAESTQGDASGVAFSARGSWRGEAVNVAWQSTEPMPWLQSDASGPRLPFVLDADIGDTHLALQGKATDALGLAGLDARVQAAGVSIATLGQALDLVLPPRAPFQAAGRVTTERALWRVDLDRLQIGSSELKAQLTLDRRGAVPRLAGRVAGSRLAWDDVAPPWPAGALVSAVTTLELPSLRAVDVELDIDIDAVDFDAAAPSQPLRAHSVVSGGKLSWTPVRRGTR